MTSAYSINLNFNNTIPVKTDFTFKQGDKGITLNLTTVGLDTIGTTAHIVFKRSNGTSVEAELTGQTGPSYSYTILGNEFEIPGVVVADLKLYNGDTQRVSTASFIFLVTGDTMDGVGGGTGGYSDQLEELSQEFSDTLEEYKDAFGDVGAVNPRGAYDSTADYNVLDLVSYQGSSYLCRTACKNKLPTNTTYWQVFASGGGGGTGDYDDLTDKPSINSVTLSGNKTTADLGLFSGNYNDLTNKPTIPSDFDDLADVDMTGVTNGQVPAYNSTTGKYEPVTPSGGSGGGANPNLLMNPWFTVNQRGVTTLSNVTSVYGADHWYASKSGGTGGSITFNANKTVSLVGGDDIVRVHNTVEKFGAYETEYQGKKMTCSVKLSNGTVYSITTGAMPAKTSASQNIIEQDFVTGLKMIFIIAKNTADYDFIFRIEVAAGASFTIAACKLEKGEVSTLAFDTAPDYTTELLKCQRYFYRISKASAGMIVNIGWAESATVARTMVSFPVEMRIAPTFSSSGTLKVNDAGTDHAVSNFAFTNYTQQNGLIKITSSGLTAGDMVSVVSDSALNLDFSAEL